MTQGLKRLGVALILIGALCRLGPAVPVRGATPRSPDVPPRTTPSVTGARRASPRSAPPAFVRAWGANDGNGALQLGLDLNGVAVDSSGNVYVADYSNNRVMKFTNTGTYVTQWGTFGTGNGQFNSPTGVAVDSSGNVYVADTLNFRIQKFTSTGTYMTQWTLGTQSGGPYGVAVGASGNVYVVYPAVDDVAMFTNTGSFISSWGGSGTGPGAFHTPFGIAANSAGYVYVADSGNNRIQEFTSTGAYVGQWGSPGTGPGQFAEPASVAVDSAGDVYVTDSGNSRMQEFTSTGAYVGQWGSAGKGNGQFARPDGVAVDSSGNVYVADAGNNLIQKFTSASAFLLQWGSGTGGDLFNTPRGVAVDGAGNVYVADTGNDRIEKFTGTGAFLLQWGASGTGNGLFNSPEGVAVDGAGNVYVADSGNNRIQEFTSGGVYTTQWGSQGTSNGQFNNPGGLTGDVYVADSGNNRIQEFSSTHRYMNQWGASGTGNGQFNNPEGVAIAGLTYVYVADTGNDRIQEFTASGAYVTQWGGYGTGNGLFSTPRGVALDGAGNVYVADLYNYRIQEFTNTGGYLTQWGSYGPDNGQFEGPAAVAIYSWDAIYVVDSRDEIVEEFSFGVQGPTVASVTPNTGPASGGTQVTIDGTGLSGVTGVQFGGVQASFSSGSSSQMTAWSPAGSGTVDVTVTTPAGTSAVTSADQFTYQGPTTCTSVSLAASPPNSAPIGTTIVLTAAAQSCPSPLYEYWALPPGGNWVDISPYSTAGSLMVNTSAGAPGVYQLAVWAKDASSSQPYDTFNVISYTFTPVCSAAMLSPSVPSPQALPASVTFTASATPSAGATCAYEFWGLPYGGSWRIAQSYSSTNTFQWTVPAGTLQGIYQIAVWIKATGSTQPYDSFAIVPYTLGCSVALTASPAGPANGQNVTFTATPSGVCSPNAQYQWWGMPPGGGWGVGVAYPGSPTLTVSSMGVQAGTWAVAVWERAPGSSAAYDTYAIIPYVFNGPAGTAARGSGSSVAHRSVVPPPAGGNAPRLPQGPGFPRILPPGS